MKKFFKMFMVACLGLSLAGCKADMGDVEKQAKLMEDIIEEGDLFEEDWAYTMEMSYDGESMEMTIKRDGDNWYAKMEAEDEVEEITVIKDGSKYYAYNSSTKEYTEMPEDEADIDTAEMMAAYEQFLALLTDFEEVCDVEGTTCEMEKNLFGKLTIKVEEDGAKTEFVVKKGKLLSASVETDGMTLS